MEIHCNPSGSNLVVPAFFQATRSSDILHYAKIMQLYEKREMFFSHCGTETDIDVNYLIDRMAPGFSKAHGT